ncbi:hypothetical protein G8O24_36420 [Bradyrhizobium sp. INPA01-394B]|uniref:Uncharacterized protein n=1 Tax=Bradyrhizobium campsiandrae TaxID=1729892 RepID=A0ABR7UE92_9BRAD|nr:hypothetical protein [Bradyrhizobium campsiandrae]MBC9882794.1 hypothetical protein [Bradyrhizobium campsiandrae]MBC9982279.1 hypothetical protein [Bradyrhizobium campsiandrae]
MRKIILVAAMVLVSASAQAGGARSLSQATANEQAAPAAAPTTPMTQTSEVAPVADAPTYVDRPPAVSTTAPAAATPTTSAPAATKHSPKTAKADKPRHKKWTEGRIIAELHRHGIYW